MDPDFVDELMMAATAYNDHELLSIKDAKGDALQAQVRRKAQIVKWRERVKRGK